MADTSRISTQEPDALPLAVEHLRRGDPVAFPTDTVYGVGAHAFLDQAVTHLYAIKRRPLHLPIPLLLSNAQEIESVCVKIPPAAWQLASRFWPGGLSLILTRAPTVPDAATAGGATVAVRVPDHALVRQICRQLGAPLAATSANLHGQPPPVTAGDVQAALGGQIPLLLDGGACPGGMASTVLDLTTWPPAILREGPITAGQLAALVPVAQPPAPASGR